MQHSEAKSQALFAGHSQGKMLFLAIMVGVAFLVSYGYAVAKTQPAASQFDAYGQAPLGGAAGAGAQGAGGACGCCAPGSSEQVEGQTTVKGDVQTIDVAIDLGYSPNVIRATAGIPLEITFGQGLGCFEEIYFPEFGILENLSAGPKTVTLPALEPGEYEFSCGMQMVFGKIVVE